MWTIHESAVHSRLRFAVAMLSIFAIYSWEGRRTLGAEKHVMISEESPSDVNGFSITLPGGITLGRHGAAEVPSGGYMLEQDFNFPHPSKYVLPAGTRVLQTQNGNWEGLSFRFPDGTVHRPSKADLVGIEDKAPVEQILARLPSRSRVAELCCNELKEIALRTGRAPTLANLRKMLMNPVERLTTKDYHSILATFIAEQHPKRTIEDIRLLHASLRDSITTFSAKWSMRFSEMHRSDRSGGDRTGKYYFLKDGDRLRFDAITGPDFDKATIKHTRAYDGKQEVVYDSNSLVNNAVIQSPISGQYYFEWHHPLWASRLLDSERDLAKSKSGLENFQARAAYPIEEVVIFNDTDCIALLEQETLYFLDPKKSYAYCGMEAGRYVFDEAAGKMVISDTFARERLEGHHEYGQGVWLPSHAEFERVNKGVSSVTVAEYHEMSVNEPIDSSLFQNTVPDGAEVLDGIHGFAYIQGGAETVSKSINRYVLPRNEWSLQKLILVFATIALSLLLLFLVWLRLSRAG